MSNKLFVIVFIALLSVVTIHEMSWAESKCEELGNTPQQCAALME